MIQPSSVLFSRGDSRVGLLQTVKGIFGIKGEFPVHIDNPLILAVVDKRKVQVLATLGIILAATALIITTLALMAIFCPPVLAAIGGGIGVAALGCSSTMGVFGLLGASLPLLIAVATTSGITGIVSALVGILSIKTLWRGKQAAKLPQL